MTRIKISNENQTNGKNHIDDKYQGHGNPSNSDSGIDELGLGLTRLSSKLVKRVLVVFRSFPHG
jgi:hypothetical protein